MASDWQRYLQSQMQAFGLAQQPQAPQAAPPPEVMLAMARAAQQQQAAPPTNGRLGRGMNQAMQMQPVRMREAPPRPQTYQDPSDVKSQAIQEVRETYEYAQAVGAGLSDQDAILWVLREAIAGQQPKPRPQEGGINPIEAVVDAGQYAVQSAPEYVQAMTGTNVDPEGNPLQEAINAVGDFWGLPDEAFGVDLPGKPNPVAPKPELTPQEEQQNNQAQIEARNWEEVLKPQYQAAFPEEELNAEIERVQAEIERLENTYPSAMTGEGTSTSIGAPPEEGQELLDQQLDAANLELNQLLAIRGALYAPEPDQPWYIRTWNAIVGSPVGDALNLYDMPSKFVRQNLGGLMILMAANGSPLGNEVLNQTPWGQIAVTMGSVLSPEEVNRAYEEGGAGAVWEYAVGRYPELAGMSEAERAIFLGTADTIYDPLNALGAGAVAAKGIPLLGGLLHGADVASNLPGHLVISGAGKVADATKAAPGIGKLFEPGQTAITREIGQTAEDLAPQIERGIDPDAETVTALNPITGGPTIGGRPIESASIGGFTELNPTISPASIGGFSEATIAATPPPRPSYADETPFSDADYTEYRARLEAGEESSDIIESIYAREQAADQSVGQQGAPEGTDVREDVGLPGVPGRPVLSEISQGLPSRENPLGDLLGESPIRPRGPEVDDLTGMDAPTGARPSPPISDPSIPRPRYGDGTPFSEDDYQRYLANYGDEAANDELIRTIDNERLTAQQAGTTPARPITPTPKSPVGVSPDAPVVDGPVVPGTVADAPRAPEVSGAETPARPDVARYADDPEVRDIPQELKGTNDPGLRDYGIKGYIQTPKGWKETTNLRAKGVKFFASGQKAWRQVVRTIERDIESGVPLREAPAQPGVRPVDQETESLITRYVTEPNPKTASGILRVLDGPGRNSYIDEAGNRFVQKGDTTWQDAGGGREALNAVSMDGKQPAVIFRNTDNSYTIVRGDVEAPAKIRALGGMGDSANNPYVPELIDRIKVARERFQNPGKRSPEALGITADDIVEGVKRGPLGTLGRKAERITRKDGKLEVIPEAEVTDVATLREGNLTDDLARFGWIPEEGRRWLNTSINTNDIRWDNLTTSERKMAVQALGIDAGAGAKVKDIKELVDATAKTPGFKAPTRGEIYEQLLETMADSSREARIEVWNKVIGGVPPPRGRAGRALGNMGAMVRGAILHNWVRAPYNLMQDALTNHFVYMVDGQSGVSKLHARLMRDIFEQSERSTRIKGSVGKDGNIFGNTADDVDRFSSATQEVAAVYDSLDIPIPAMVKSAFGGKFDEGLGRFLENGATYWSDMGRKYGGKPGEMIGSFFASPTVKALRSNNDDLMRLSGSTDYILRNYDRTYQEFLDEIREQARLGKFDADDAITRLQRTGSDIFGMSFFSPEDVARVISPYDAKRAEHLTRRWRGRVNALNKGATNNVKKMSFSYMPTRADEAIGKVWMFHYWMTRASVQHARLALEHPPLMVQYLRTWQGMEKMKDRENMPAWARQFVSLMAGPYGMMGLVSPASILTGLSVVMDANGVLDDPSIGSLLQQMPFHPIVQAAASVYLTERLPDPTGTNGTRQFAKAAINYLRNEMGVGSEGLTGDPLANLTYKIQQLARSIAPDLGPIEAVSLSAPSPGQKDTQMVKYYAAEIMRNTPDPETGGTLFQNPDGSITDYASQVMANIDAGLYSGAVEAEALDQFSTDTFTGRVAMSTLPIQSLYPSVIGDAREENRSGYTAENQPLQLDTTTSPESMAFIDPSRPATTIEKGGSLAVDLGDAGSPVSAQLVAALDQYGNLGTPDTQELYGNYNNAIYMSGDELKQKYGGIGIRINGEDFMWEIWDALPEDARRTYMDAWLKTKGRYEEISAYRAERDAFAAAHPEVEEFKRWQSTVGEKGSEAMLEQLLSGRYPAFEAWWKTQDASPAKAQQILMTPSAYLASIGHEPSLWDINDISTKPTVDSSKASPLDQIAPKDTSNTGFSSDRPFEALTPEEKVVRINEKLAVYSAEMDLFNQTIAPYTGGKPYTALGPQGIAILDAIMQNKGITMPSMPSVVKDYVDWMSRQSGNADTSISAYVASLADEAIAA